MLINLMNTKIFMVSQPIYEWNQHSVGVFFFNFFHSRNVLKLAVHMTEVILQSPTGCVNQFIVVRVVIKACSMWFEKFWLIFLHKVWWNLLKLEYVGGTVRLQKGKRLFRSDFCSQKIIWECGEGYCSFACDREPRENLCGVDTEANWYVLE